MAFSYLVPEEHLLLRLFGCCIIALIFTAIFINIGCKSIIRDHGSVDASLSASKGGCIKIIIKHL